MTVQIAAIVEGHGECEAVPVLIRRVAAQIDPGFVPVVLPPLRIPASKLRLAAEIERAVELAARKLRGSGGIVIILDCDWSGGCPATDAPELLARATGARSDLPIAVILANKEFENWFVAAADSLHGKRGLPVDLEAPDRPEDVRGAKEWLSHRMQSRVYSPAEDQAALTAEFDMAAARKADSFDKCYREIARILSVLRQDK
jgi:hypothetical protein